MSDVKGIEISNIFGLEKPTTKLIECVSAGLGKAYEPIHIRRMAKAKQKEIKLIGDAITENIKLPTVYKDGNITIDSSSAEELIKRTGNRLLFTEIRKQQNIESIISETYNQLENEEKVTREPVNQDWLVKFFDNAGDISDENMQKIWSKILIGEIKNPNTYTLRTLNTLKNITTLEANLYEKIVPFIFYEHNNPFLYRNTELLEKYGVSFSNLLKLEDCGLISLNGFVIIDFGKQQNMIYSDNIVALINDKIKIDIYTITESGKQILKIVKDTIKSNDEYFLELCKKIKEKNKNIEMGAYTIKKCDENGIEYDEKKNLIAVDTKE